MNTLQQQLIDGGNRTFLPERFRLYMRLYLAHNGRRLLMMAAVMLLAMLAFTFLPYFFMGFDPYADALERMHTEDPMQTYQRVIYVLLGAFFATVAGTMLFGVLRGKNARLSMIQLPASQLEKWLAYFVIYFVAFAVLYIVGIYVCELMRVGVMQLFRPAGYQLAQIMSPARLLYLHEDSVSVWTALLPVTIILGAIIDLHAVFAAGSAFWARLTYIYTCIYLGVMAFACSVLFGVSMLMFRTNPTFRFTEQIETMVNDNSVSVETIASGFVIFLMILFVGLFVGLHALAYARFREADIVNKW